MSRPLALGALPQSTAGPAALSMRAFVPAHFLRQQAWFTGLEAQDQEFLLRSVSMRRVRGADVVLPAGEAPQAWHAVISGTLMVERRDRAGQAAVLMPARSGDWLDEEFLVRRIARQHDVVAHSDGELLCLDAAAFHALLQRSDGFRGAVFGLLASRLERTTTALEVARIPNAEERLAECLMRWSADGRQHVRLNQSALGQVAGISRQTANRVLRALQARGIVDLRDGQVLRIDQEGLQGWLGQQRRKVRGTARACEA